MCSPGLPCHTTTVGSLVLEKGLIRMRVVDGGSMSRTWWLRYVPGDTQHKQELVDMIETKNVYHLLRALKHYNDVGDLAVEEKHASTPWALVLCMKDGHNTLFRVLDDQLLLRDIPVCCADALVIFTKPQMLQHTLNVVHGPTSLRDFEFCAQHIAHLNHTGTHPQLHVGVIPMRYSTPQAVSTTKYIIGFLHCS